MHPFSKKKRLTIITIAYWFLLSYLIAALAWWFIELWQQNSEMYLFKKELLQQNDPSYPLMIQKITAERDLNNAQYIGEGLTFLLLTVAGAIFVYRATRRQIRLNNQQQNFMMALTHELKTPIAITKLNLETLNRHALDAEKQRKVIDSTLQETNRLNDLCNNILLSSQLDAGGFRLNKEQSNLSNLLIEITDDFRQRFPKRKISRDIKENLFYEADHLLLQLALNNLMENALKYSPPEKNIHVALSADDKNLHISFSDEGKGIPDSEKKKIFGKFYRIGDENTRKAKGTGLGLYLTQKIVEDHEGTVFVTDNIPTGSNFVILFPKINGKK
jgi:two-component system, OmpR family, sensor histidine kinase CiaH